MWYYRRTTEISRNDFPRAYDVIMSAGTSEESMGIAELKLFRERGVQFKRIYFSGNDPPENIRNDQCAQSGKYYFLKFTLTINVWHFLLAKTQEKSKQKTRT